MRVYYVNYQDKSSLLGLARGVRFSFLDAFFKPTFHGQKRVILRKADLSTSYPQALSPLPLRLPPHSNPPKALLFKALIFLSFFLCFFVFVVRGPHERAVRGPHEGAVRGPHERVVRGPHERVVLQSVSRIPHMEFNFLITGRIRGLLRACRCFARGL